MQDTVKEISEKPADTQERYSTAAHASNLRVQADRSGPADLLIGMAWSPVRLGGELMRLASEWDACEKPRRADSSLLTTMARALSTDSDGLTTVTGDDGKDRKISPAHAASEAAATWHLHELKLMFQKLKTMPTVRTRLTGWIREQGIGDAERRAAECLSWWLNHTCPTCQGRKKETVPGTPSLSHRDCKACKGTGKTRVPHAVNNTRQLVESWKILRHIDFCVKTAAGSTRARLQGMRQRPAQSNTKNSS